MDFLETTAVLIPALTGVPVTLYSGDRLVLDQFQRRFCFSSDRQRLYTAAGLEAFLAGGAEELVYDLTEPLGTRLTAFRAGGRWALLGPYVAEGWNGGAARALLAKVGASEAAVKPFKAYRCKLPIAQRDQRPGRRRLCGLSGQQLFFQGVQGLCGVLAPGLSEPPVEGRSVPLIFLI